MGMRMPTRKCLRELEPSLPCRSSAHSPFDTPSSFPVTIFLKSLCSEEDPKTIKVKVSVASVAQD